MTVSRHRALVILFARRAARTGQPAPRTWPGVDRQGLELISESGLRRDVVYADHKDLVEEFQAHVKAQDSTPTAMRELAEENAKLKAKLTEIKAELAEGRATGVALRQAVAEFSLELQQAREELTTAGSIARLPTRSGGVNGPTGTFDDSPFEFFP